MQYFILQLKKGCIFKTYHDYYFDLGQSGTLEMPVNK